MFPLLSSPTSLEICHFHASRQTQTTNACQVAAPMLGNKMDQGTAKGGALQSTSYVPLAKLSLSRAGGQQSKPGPVSGPAAFPSPGATAGKMLGDPNQNQAMPGSH